MLDLTLLRVLKYRKQFLKLRGRIPDGAVDAQTQAILKDYEKYFHKFPEHDRIDFNTFLPLFRAWHSSLKDDKRSLLEAIITKADKDVEKDVKDEVMKTLLELRLANSMATTLDQFDTGELSNIYQHMDKELRMFKSDVGISDALYIDDDISDIINDMKDDTGLQWRLSCLNESLRPLQPGDWGIIAGRPDTGKTSFIASELTYMAPQLNNDKNIVWLNNEGIGRNLYMRIYQAALGITRDKLFELNDKKLLVPVYKKVIGRVDKIRVVDIHGKDNFQVEQIIEGNNAGIVVFDMLDNVRGFGDAARTDIGLEKMYQWGRELMVSTGCIGLATSQISGDGEGLQFPSMSMLKDSKTGKQGASDFQLMIGASLDPGYASTRWISVPKNKLRKDSGPADPRCAVHYDSKRSRYEDMQMGDVDAQI